MRLINSCKTWYDFSRPAGEPYQKEGLCVITKLSSCWLQHCQAGDTLLGHAPVWLSAVIFLLIGGIIGALSGVLGMLWRQKQLRRQTYLTADHVYDGASQPTGTSSAVSYQQAGTALCKEQTLHVLSFTLQAQTIPYKHAWRSVPAASHSGYGTASPSSQQSAFLGQEYGRKPLSQRLLQEEAIRKSGVSGPLGIGVVMHSEYRICVRSLWKTKKLGNCLLVNSPPCMLFMQACCCAILLTVCLYTECLVPYLVWCTAFGLH